MSTTAQTYTKEKPFLTNLLENRKLNKEGSKKDTRHFVISLKGSDIEYLPGDSLYVFPENEESLVNKLLNSLELVKTSEEEFERFKKEVNITRSSTKLFKLIETKLQEKGLNETIDPAQYEGYNLANIILDIKNKYALSFTTEEIVENSSKLMARAYSIASSLRAHPQEVHLCIARVDEEINGQKVLGVCSNYLSERVNLNGMNLRIYLHINEKFRLPENPETDIIMVGPGTGIAPFRAFIEERNAQRDSGEKVGLDWLFFGDQRAAYDYLYAEEFAQYAKKYNLKISTAFSRDQEEKVYVQNRMLENAQEIFKLLETGAHFYVCGDARRMAKDVDLALREIITKNGKNADDYMKNLKESGRYQRDIY